MSPQDKTYLVLDTNILLLDANNLLSLGRDSTIVLPETVLDEIDSKKSGHTEIAFQARAFGRLLARAGVAQVVTHQGMVITKLTVEDVNIHIVALDNYPDYQDTELAIKNDRKIIEVALRYAESDGTTKFISNDVMCRIRAQSLGLEVDDVKDVDDTEILFTKTVGVSPSVFATIHNRNIYDIDPDHQPENSSYKFICEDQGYTKIATIQNSLIHVIGKDSEKKLRQQIVNPQNAEQLIMSSLILDQSVDLTVVEALAGSGKTIMAMSLAMKLVGTNSPYDNIMYIRNTVDDVAEKDEEVGFLSGNDEKMAVYLHPYHDTLASIARMSLSHKYRGRELEERISEKVESLVGKYHIDATVALGLRGRTFDNSVIIIDEAQNMSKATMQKVLSRVGKNCKVIVIGSLRQIDSKYITKYTSGLAVLLESTKRKDLPIKINAVNLQKVVRGPITEFAELIFSKH